MSKLKNGDEVYIIFDGRIVPANINFVYTAYRVETAYYLLDGYREFELFENIEDAEKELINQLGEERLNES